MQLVAASMRWGMLVLIVVMLVWLMSMVFPKLEQDQAEPARARE